MRLILFFFVLYCLPSYGQKDYDSIRNTAPREKLYIHFDKSTYALTDTIWFKAYLTDASTHASSALSGLIYTELINPGTGEVVQRLSLPTQMGLTWGSFALNPNKFKPGNYIFRAYTNWMQNFGDTHFFKKEFKIVNLVSEQLPIIKKSDTSLKQRLQDIDLQFLPEGGKWIAGMPQKLAFKAIDASGTGIAVHGTILDSKKEKVIDFQSNALGMGFINLLPAIGEGYVAQVNYNDLVKEIELPKPQQNGTILQLSNPYNRDSIKVTVYSNQLFDREITILGQSRGQLYFTSRIRLNNNIKFIYIPKSIFATGVNQVILTDGSRTINERSFFINHKDELQLSINTSQSLYGMRDSIPLQLNAFDKHGKPVDGSFSIAVTDDTQVTKDSVNDATILSYLLLSSDLKGEVQNPGYYFHQPNEQKHNDLDALMLTQGWVSYDWDLSKKPSFRMEKEYTINGRVYGVFNKPIPNAKMTMLGKNRGMLMINTIANDKGEFTFDDLPLMDSASLVIQAKNIKDKAGSLTIEVEEFKAPMINATPRKTIIRATPIDSVAKNFIATKIQESKVTFKEGTLLNEVTIIGKKVIKNSKNLNGPGEADQTITEEELNKVAKKSLFDLLVEQVKGFNLKYNTPRGIFIGFDTLKLVFDGVNVDNFYERVDPITRLPHASNDYYNYLRSFLDNYHADDIRGIELMSSYGNRSRYRARDINAMTNKWTFVEITTRAGLGPFLKNTPNIYKHKPINYGDTKKFYSPRYTAANRSDKKPDFRSTIYWNPNLVTDEKGQAQTSFFSADKKGSYTVWIEGSDLQGNFGFKAFKLIIK